MANFSPILVTDFSRDLMFWILNVLFSTACARMSQMLSNDVAVVGVCHRRRVRHLDSSSGEVVLALVKQVGAVFTLHSRREDDGEYIVRRGDST